MGVYQFGGSEPNARLSQSGRYNVAVTFAIRDYKTEDFENLWRIDQDCFPPGISYSRRELKYYIRRRGAFTLVAAEPENGSIAGFLVAHTGATGHIVTIDVVAADRRSGVGSQLLRAAELRLQAAGCHGVALETAVDNVSALSFYKRHGYDVVKTMPRYYSNGVDGLAMRKQWGGTEERRSQ
jgi:[ribosomal protein S18]-alanine N-acetyltransferase